MKYLKSFESFKIFDAPSEEERKVKIEKAIELIADSLQAIFDDYEISFHNEEAYDEPPEEDIYWEYSYFPINREVKQKNWNLVKCQINICNIGRDDWSDIYSDILDFIESVGDGLYGDIPKVELAIEEIPDNDNDYTGILIVRFEDSLQDEI